MLHWSLVCAVCGFIRVSCLCAAVNAIDTPQGRPIDGNFAVEVSGRNFFPDMTTVLINGTVCANITVTEDCTAISCMAPVGAGT